MYGRDLSVNTVNFFEDLRISCDIQVIKTAQGNMAVEVISNVQNFYLVPNINYHMLSFSKHIYYVCC